ncbi:placenta-expressed transcript 1 protein-like [Apodemus sylvaticus]|uniref:placenta-expressed transcript 1 protein-like n=1 Tax=Apodemus sylvaticus TaxID=10129 RepID=UPI002244D4AA|nr:placenta-expressed transcript 1 protein-like [Apodemus sylvaticus]
MHDLTSSSSPRAYKQEPVAPSLTTYCQALQPKQTGTMPALRSVLPHLGLFLCLALCFFPSLSASDESCVVFDAVYTSDNLGINITAQEVSGGNVSYAVTVPVNNTVSAVIVKAVKENGIPVGTWGGPHQKCNDSSVYYLSNPDTFQTNWTVPDSEDVTKVNLQVFIVVNRIASVSSLKVEGVKSSILTPPPESFETSQTMTTTTAMNTAKTTAVNTAKTTAMNTAKTTDMNTAKTTAMTPANSTAISPAKTTAISPAKTTARSLAIRTLSSPLAGALHILLVFLISKLLF